MNINTIARSIEKGIIYTLIVLMAMVLVLATIELGWLVATTVKDSDYLLIGLAGLMDLFGVFLLVLIGIELLDTIKVYLKSNIVHVEVVVLVAIIALARKVVVLDIEEISGDVLLGLAAMILVLAIAYFLIKRAGLLMTDTDEPQEVKKVIKDTINEERAKQ